MKPEITYPDIFEYTKTIKSISFTELGRKVATERVKELQAKGWKLIKGELYGDRLGNRFNDELLNGFDCSVTLMKMK